jgi:hypothetical protein
MQKVGRFSVHGVGGDCSNPTKGVVVNGTGLTHPATLPANAKSGSAALGEAGAGSKAGKRNAGFSRRFRSSAVRMVF